MAGVWCGWAAVSAGASRLGLVGEEAGQCPAAGVWGTIPIPVRVAKCAKGVGAPEAPPERFALVVASRGEAYEVMAGLSRETKVKYASLRGYAFLDYTGADEAFPQEDAESFDRSWHARAGARVRALRDALDRGHEWAIWTDADVLVTNPEVRLEDLVKMFGAYDEEDDEDALDEGYAWEGREEDPESMKDDEDDDDADDVNYTEEDEDEDNDDDDEQGIDMWESPSVFMSRDWGETQINTGVVFVRNTIEGRYFLDHWAAEMRENPDDQLCLRDGLLKRDTPARRRASRSLRFVPQRSINAYASLALEHGEVFTQRTVEHDPSHALHRDGDFMVHIVNCIRQTPHLLDAACCDGVAASYHAKFHEALRRILLAEETPRLPPVRSPPGAWKLAYPHLV